MTQINYENAGRFLPANYTTETPIAPDTLVHYLHTVCGLRVMGTANADEYHDYFRGVSIMIYCEPGQDSYSITYKVDLGYGMTLTASRYCHYAYGIPDVDADCSYMSKQATIADQYPSTFNLMAQTGVNVFLAFRLAEKTGDLQGYYTGEGFAPIYCTKPPTNSALVKRIIRKLQK
jgi:hypothetical protein